MINQNVSFTSPNLRKNDVSLKKLTIFCHLRTRTFFCSNSVSASTAVKNFFPSNANLLWSDITCNMTAWTSKAFNGGLGDETATHFLLWLKGKIYHVFLSSIFSPQRTSCFLNSFPKKIKVAIRRMKEMLFMSRHKDAGGTSSVWMENNDV